MSDRFTNPKIIIISPLDADTCTYISDGWYESTIRHLPEAKAIKARADRAIKEAEDVPDAIRLLEDAGFEVEHNVNYLEEIQNMPLEQLLAKIMGN